MNTSVLDQHPSGDNISSDHNAFEQVVKQYEGCLFGFLYSLTGNADEARDLTQETFIRVYRRLPLYDPDRPFKNWLLTVARNLYRDSIRKRSRTVSLDKLAEEGFFSVRDPQSDPEQSAIERETRSNLWTALQQLDPDEREVLVLKDISEMNYSEIAGLMNIPAGTVASRIYYARRSLRVLLEGDGNLRATVSAADSRREQHSRAEAA